MSGIRMCVDYKCDLSGWFTPVLVLYKNNSKSNSTLLKQSQKFRKMFPIVLTNVLSFKTFLTGHVRVDSSYCHSHSGYLFLVVFASDKSVFQYCYTVVGHHNY